MEKIIVIQNNGKLIGLEYEDLSFKRHEDENYLQFMNRAKYKIENEKKINFKEYFVQENIRRLEISKIKNDMLERENRKKVKAKHQSLDNLKKRVVATALAAVMAISGVAVAKTALNTENVYAQTSNVKENFMTLITEGFVNNALMIAQNAMEYSKQPQDFDSLLNTVQDESTKQDLKIKVILERDGYTEEQFWQMASIVLAEAAGGGENYTDAYGVASCALNRTNSQKWNSFVEQFYEKGSGESMYYQLTCPNQFVVYPSGDWYLKFLNMDKEEVKKLEGFHGFLDCLYTKKPMHNYLSYLAAELSGEKQFVENGNWYSNQMEESDRLSKKPVEEETKKAQEIVIDEFMKSKTR